MKFKIARLYTPANLPRLVVEDINLPSNGEIVPTGTITSTNVALMHRNEEATPEFRPSRFPNDTELRKAGSSFVAFGAGVHPYSGCKFAMMKIALFLVKAFSQFEFTLLNGNQRQ